MFSCRCRSKVADVWEDAVWVHCRLHEQVSLSSCEKGPHIRTCSDIRTCTSERRGQTSSMQ